MTDRGRRAVPREHVLGDHLGAQCCADDVLERRIFEVDARRADAESQKAARRIDDPDARVLMMLGVRSAESSARRRNMRRGKGVAKVSPDLKF